MYGSGGNTSGGNAGDKNSSIVRKSPVSTSLLPLWFPRFFICEFYVVRVGDFCGTYVLW